VEDATLFKPAKEVTAMREAKSRVRFVVRIMPALSWEVAIVVPNGANADLKNVGQKIGCSARWHLPPVARGVGRDTCGAGKDF
jgi:hypothetical protein